MNISEIPLSPDNQQFSINLAGTTYQMRILWRSPCWYLDLMLSDHTPVAMALPLLFGTDLLAQYASAGLGFSLVVGSDSAEPGDPTQTDLGITSHLYVITE